MSEIKEEPISDEFSKILELFPFSKERQEKINDLTKDSNYRALLINQLIITVSQDASDNFRATQILSEAKSIARLLKITLKTNIIK